MATLFFILVIAAIFHFIYESILLPMLRLELRYKLFGLRDQLRHLKSENTESISDNVFYLLEETICTTINRLPYLSISSRVDATREFETNPTFRKRVEDRVNLLRSCDNTEVKQITKGIADISFYTFILNAGGWIYILVPLLIVVLIFAFITQKVTQLRKYLTAGVDKLTFASDNDFGKFSHI
ncbi:MAG: hypothetical protein ABI426_07420 [Flavobacterium sp.]